MGNLALRVLFAAVAIPVVVGLVYLGSVYYFALVLAMTLAAYYEYCTMLKARGFFTAAASAGFVFITAVFLRSFTICTSWVANDFLILAFVFMLAFSELAYKTISFSVSRMSVQFFGAAYLAFTGYAIYTIGTLMQPGWKIIVPFLAAIWLSDTVAYFVGRFAGRHLLYPAISPKKTVEGGIGAIAGSILGFAFILIWNSEIGISRVLILGTLIGIAGQVGDFTESMIKRWAGVKDSSNILPGHGGVFDRIDSMLFAAPFVVFYFRYIL